METNRIDVGDYIRPGYGCTLKIDIGGRTLYNFDPKSGILEISIGSRNLKSLLNLIGEIPKTGRDIELPSTIGYAATFKGVKKIKSFRRTKNNAPLLNREFIRKLEGILKRDKT